MAARAMLNIGCGATHHPDWVNLDMSPSDPAVLSVDISKGLPFPDGSVAVCYSSHLLEHLDSKAAGDLIDECMRVLGHGGVIRIVVPDLEGIAREYIRILESLLAGDRSREDDYDWIMLELYDQVTRNTSGGEMKSWLTSKSLQNEKYVVQRCGMEAEKIMERARQKNLHDAADAKAVHAAKCKNLFHRMSNAMLRFLFKDKYKALQIGRFRLGGEVHQWMYDQFSLTRLLLQHGFVDIKRCTAFESRIPAFEKYGLDVLNGKIRKPDSIFIEAAKP